MTTTALSELAKKLFEAYSRNSGNPPDCHHDRNAAEQWMAQAMEECRLSSAEPVALGYVNPKDVADGTATLIWPKNLAAAAYVPVFAHAQPAALGTPLYHAANRLMLVIGHDGDISSRAPECDALMRVLRDIDGGEYKPAAKVEAPASVLDGCHVVRYNGDGEFGQKVGWLYRTGGDPCVISGKPVYVWRPIAELLETTV